MEESREERWMEIVSLRFSRSFPTSSLLTSIDLFLFERPSRGVNYLTEYRSRDLRFRIDDAR